SERTKRERFKLEAELKRRQQEISEEGKQKIRDLTNPLTQAERKAILDAIDDILGIRIDPDEPAAEVGRVVPGAPPIPSSDASVVYSSRPQPANNTVEKSAESKAEYAKNTVEKSQPTNDERPEALTNPA